MSKTKKLTTMAVLTALSIALALVARFPIFPPIEYDAGDIPILISGFLFGPLAGVSVALVKAIVQDLVVSGAGPYGMLMNFISTGTFVLVASLIYHRGKTMKTAIIGLVCGAVATVLIMIPANLIIMPLWGIPSEVVRTLLLPVIIPANASKGVINGFVTFLLYKPISNLIKIPPNTAGRKRNV